MFWDRIIDASETFRLDFDTFLVGDFFIEPLSLLVGLGKGDENLEWLTECSRLSIGGSSRLLVVIRTGCGFSVNHSVEWSSDII